MYNDPNYRPKHESTVLSKEAIDKAAALYQAATGSTHKPKAHTMPKNDWLNPAKHNNQ